MRTATRLAVACVAAATLFASGGVAAQTDDDAAERAAQEIAAARERANQAAEAFFEAESRIGVLEDEQIQLSAEIDQLNDDVELLREAVASVAVNRFVTAGADGIPLLTDFRSPNDRVQADVLVTIVSESGASAVDDYEAARLRLENKREELADSKIELRETQAALSRLQAEAEAEVERLREVEAQRLEDEAVRKALEARQREEQRQLEELQRRQAEANRQANPSPGVSVLPAASAITPQGNTSGTTRASGGTAGGRTGGGGGGTNPRLATDGYIDMIVCPIQGGSAYGDTWGAPRSGGRRHLGVDMLAPTGTPLQAVVSGVVTQKSNRLGGMTLSLLGDNGNRYYYAHLSAYEGVGGRVEQGAVVGYVGDTGNATGTPHLHFEIRPGNGVNTNPYPSVRSAGC